ncbi:hypothetical protein O1L60_45020 [Streptomyces diastatochromogenes]|nr:hypothetical protein [Streptomyces diastatochromogenes]
MCDAPFVMERAEWLGYVAGRHGAGGLATAGSTYDEMKAEVKAVAYHEEQPDGSWVVLLYPLDGRPPQAQQTDEPVTTLHSSLTVASFLADAVMAPNSTVLHTIGGDPYRLVAEYRQRHADACPVVNRMWTAVRDVPEELLPTG